MIKKYNAIGLQLTLKLADYKLYGKPKDYDIENGYVYLDDGTDDDDFYQEVYNIGTVDYNNPTP